MDHQVKESLSKRQQLADERDRKQMAGHKRKISAAEWCADVVHSTADTTSQQLHASAIHAAAGDDQRPVSEVGASLLQKLGWNEGEKLGKGGGEANAPIEVVKRRDRVGLGCANSVDTDAQASTLTSAKALLLKKTMERYNGLL